MSKKNSSSKVPVRLLIAALVCAQLVCGGAAAVAVASQKARRAAAVNPRTAAVRAATAEVLQETSEIRKLKVRRPVRSGAQSRAEIEKMLVRNLDASSTPEELNASELTYKKLGLTPADFRLRAFLISLLTEQVAGYYEPKTRQFYLADWIDLDGQKPVMAHELTHALQDQHFDLKRFDKLPKHESDATLAAHALVEGDAMILMTQYVMRSPARQLAMLRSLVTGGAGSTEQYDKAPRVLRETLVFPYVQGSAWAGQLFKRGGWDAISSAYKNLPQSTEQILHPEKYFALEAPTKVPFKSISAALGKDWKVAEQDVNGEWNYYLILDEFLQSKELSQKAAEGWGGDRYVLYTGPNKGDVLLTQKTVWDTEPDAQEFYEAYVRRTTKRYAADPLAPESADRRFWNTKEGGVHVERLGSTVVIIEGIPENVKPETLVALLMAKS
jgi:hypothetical protein